jgi:hypothetical protein
VNTDGKMKLYHFTRFDAFRQIMKDGRILPGTIAAPIHMPTARMVSLTTEENAGSGHGLPDGRRISFAQARLHQLYQVVEGNTYLFDATAVRLGVLLDINDPRVFSASDLYKHDPDLLDRLECAGYFPERFMTSDDKASISDEFLTGEAMSKGGSWYYFDGGIPFAGEDVAFRGVDDVYFYLPSTSATFA